MSEGRSPFEILSGARAPAALEREDRVRLLGKFAEAVIAGREPDREAALFVAGGLRAWLTEGGNLTKDHWRTVGTKGSTATESVIWRKALLEALLEERREETPRRTVAGTSSPKG